MPYAGHLSIESCCLQSARSIFRLVNTFWSKQSKLRQFTLLVGCCSQYKIIVLRAAEALCRLATYTGTLYDSSFAALVLAVWYVETMCSSTRTDTSFLIGSMK
jgi:hypothetical protein